jgi:hypothetical protein
MSSMHSGSLAQAPQLVLEGTLGVPQNHRAAVSPLDLKTSDEGFAPTGVDEDRQAYPLDD